MAVTLFMQQTYRQ